MRAASYLLVMLLPFVINARLIAQPPVQPKSPATGGPPSQPAEPAALARWLVERMDAGEFEAAVESFDETMRAGLPAEKLAEVWRNVSRPAGAFQGVGEPRVRDAGELKVVVLPGTWTNAKLDIQVTVNADGTIGGLFFRPAERGAEWKRPTYADEAKIKETAITIGNEPFKLPGKLCMPRGKGPHPGVVLIQGSGPQDMDETIGPNKPFRDLAWGLASRGIASVRYDKRTLTHGKKIVAEGPSARNEVIDDALLALKQLRQRPEIDKKATFIIGHSLGGCLAPVIAKSDGNLAGIVILSGTLRDLDVVLLEQLEHLAGTPGPQQEQTKKELPSIRADIEAMRAGKKKPDDVIFFAPVSYWQDINAQLGETGAKALREFPGRVLILGGGRDLQIKRVDFDKWRSAAGERKGVTFRWLPDVNHLFFKGVGPGDANDYEKPGNVDAGVIEGLASWIKGGEYPETKAPAK